MTNIPENQEMNFAKYIAKFNAHNCANILLIRYGLSKMIDLSFMISDLPSLSSKLAFHRSRAKQIHTVVLQQFDAYESATVYLFTDNDVLVALQYKNEGALAAIKEKYEKIAQCLPTGISEFLLLAENIQYCRRLAEERLMHIGVIGAYTLMSDVTKINAYAALRRMRSKPLVMVVDSDPQSAEFVRNLVAPEYDAFVVHSGPAAIHEYIKRAPDCAVVDLNTAGLSGMEVSVCIKAIDIQAFIVMMSNDAIQQKIIDSFNSGAGDFIKKPFNKTRLMKAINKSPYISGSDSASLEEMQDSEEIFLF